MRFAIPFVSLLAASAFAAPIAFSEEISSSPELATSNFLSNSDVIIQKRSGVFNIISSILGGSSGISNLANSAISALGAKFDWSSDTITIIKTITDDVITIGMNVAGMFLKKRDLDCPYATTKAVSFDYSNSTTSTVSSTTSTVDSTSTAGTTTIDTTAAAATTSSTPERELQKNIMRAYMKAVMNESDLEAINDDLKTILSDLSDLVASKKKRGELLL
ncbi:unnamed protein product [Ambrosiozyma monospora]|uniref:Unnamed protein product n=1 Tax=Ambrosiozyma monospora TaxID=43982 RepID=A0A9W6WHU8_AMBMO|nr:unnamed protein product [Ambrosiozyma monospora]